MPKVRMYLFQLGDRNCSSQPSGTHQLGTQAHRDPHMVVSLLECWFQKLLCIRDYFIFFRFHRSLQKFLHLYNMLLDSLPRRNVCFCIRSDQIRSVTQSCLTLCDPMNRSTPGLPVHHQLLEFTQTHIHRVSDAIQPSHPLSSPSPPAPNPSQHQSLFQ